MRGIMITIGGSTCHTLMAFARRRLSFVYGFIARGIRRVHGGRIAVSSVRGIIRNTLRRAGPLMTGDCESCHGCGRSFMRVLSRICGGDRSVVCVKSGRGDGASDTLISAGQDLVFGRLGGRLCRGFFVAARRVRTYHSKCVCVRSVSTHHSAVGYYLFGMRRILGNKFRVKGL